MSLKANAYTLLLTDGSYYIEREQAEAVLCALRRDDPEVRIAVAVPGEPGATREIRIATDSIFKLVPHDALINAELAELRARRRSHVAEISDYLARRSAVGER